MAAFHSFMYLFFKVLCSGSGMLQLVVFLLEFVGQISHCISQQISCSIIQMQSGTIYNIPDFNATDCNYSWSNFSNIAFANSGGKLNDFVTFSNKTFLLTFNCYEWMKYTRSCISEGDEKTVICETNCRVAESLYLPANHWITPLVVICVLLLIVTILCCIFKNKLCSCSKRLYSAVNQRSNQVNMEDVEAQRH